MENLIRTSTKTTPNVEFFETGVLKMGGRSFSEDPKQFFEPLINWCQELTTDTMQFEIKLDYLNTSSTKFMSEVIRTIDANNNIQNKEIKWFFEEDDEDMLEVGQFIEESTHSTQFSFHQLMEM